MRERYTYHDSAPPRQQPLICTGAEPIQPVHSPPKLRATRVDAPKMGFHFRHFFAVFIYIGGVCQGNEDHSVSLSMSCRWATISPSASAMCVSAACCACVSGICESIITLVSALCCACGRAPIARSGVSVTVVTENVLHLALLRIRPFQSGSSAWFSPFLLCANHTCVFVYVCLYMRVCKYVTK